MRRRCERKKNPGRTQDRVEGRKKREGGKKRWRRERERTRLSAFMKDADHPVCILYKSLAASDCAFLLKTMEVQILFSAGFKRARLLLGGRGREKKGETGEIYAKQKQTRAAFSQRFGVQRVKNNNNSELILSRFFLSNPS